MTKIVAVLVVALLATPSSALATLPTNPNLVGAIRVARHYWHGNPPCGNPPITFAAMPPQRDGEAIPSACVIVLSSAGDWPNYIDLCITITHEWGHLVLGMTPFPASNPADPAHSPDPYSIMYSAGPLIFAPCEADPAGRSSG